MSDSCERERNLRGRRVGVFTRRLFRLPHLATFLGGPELVFAPRTPESVDLVVGWGNKSTAERARALAARFEKPYVRLEDGFFRSVGTGPETPTLSLCVDPDGIYYDARTPSRLENLLSGRNGGEALEEDGLRARARDLMARVRRNRISKYNDSGFSIPEAVRRSAGERVLVVDQTVGDAAVSGGLVPDGGFERMLEAALREHPRATVFVKTHPEVLRGRKKGYLTDASRSRRRVVVVAEPTNPLALIEWMDRVYVATSQLGFEALVVGKPVSCFGAPFYSGWGLTDDRVPVLRRPRTRALEELAAAAWILYPRYVHPVRGEPCEVEDVVAHLELQRRLFSENRGVSIAVAFPSWKRAPTRAYLRTTEGALRFLGARGKPPEAFADRLVVWGREVPDGVEQAARERGIPVARMEDGFLRSVGLGSDIVDPLSLVLDERGIYYDPSTPSRLEEILLTHEFSADEVARARALRVAIVDRRLSKYNFSDAAPFPDLDARGRRIVLIPGQVEEDASVVLGGAGIRDNSELVRRVRRENPEALLVYKPHPDVVSGNRRGALATDAADLVDHVVVDCSLAQCLERVDEVHTLTSLVGFEALLRGKPVATYGQPFYASWGLTKDYARLARRTRRLELDELVFGVLVLYPRYYSSRIGAFVEAEDAVFELAAGLAAGSGDKLSRSRIARQVTRLGRVLRRLVRAR